MEPVPKKRFDVTEWIRLALRYQKYFRLCALLLVLGPLIGVVYFVYVSPVYQSRALIKVEGLRTPVDNAGEENPNPNQMPRVVASALSSQVLLVETARRLGFANQSSSYEGVRDRVIPKRTISLLDGSTVQVEIYSFFPEVVREFPEAMIAQYRESREREASEYRAAAIDRYLAELDDLRSKLEEKMKERFAFEKEGELTEVQVKQQQLSQVPVRLEVARFKLAELDSVLATLDSQEDSLGTIGQLSLIASYEATETLEVGRLVRNTGEKLPTAVVPLLPDESGGDRVVVRPDMVEGLERWEELEKEKRLVEREMARAAKDFLPGHPRMAAFQKRLDTIQDDLDSELEVARSRLLLERKSLQEEIGNLERQMEEYYAVTEQLDQQRLNFELLQSGELDWGKAYGEIAKDISRFRSVTDREPFKIQFDGFLTLRDQNPISPNKFKLAIMGLLLGVGMALAVPYGLEMLDDSTSTLGELERVTGLTGIGIVPLTEPELLEEIARSPMIGARVPNFLLENFRVIRSNIVLHPNRHGKSQVIMVTSARPSEGKSTGAANIAWSFYSMGARTLLIDADLRRGTSHRLLKIDNKIGLTTLFTGDSKLDEVIKETEIENLWVIPRGPVIAGTTEKLCGDEFSALVKRMREYFDRIVIDTPPVLGLSETVSLQRVVDGVVLVAQSEKTPKKDVVDAVTMLRKSGAYFFGLVLNRVDLDKTYNYYNYYYYSAHYYDSLLADDDDGEAGKGAKREEKSRADSRSDGGSWERSSRNPNRQGQPEGEPRQQQPDTVL